MIYKSSEGKPSSAGRGEMRIDGCRLTRRRVLGLLAASSAALLAEVRATPARLAPLRWQGEILGAPARLVLYHPEPEHAAVALAAVRHEIAALENAFSLFRPESALSRLNRTGRLDPAPPALLALLDRCAELHRASDGAFDPTVQPLWTLYDTHFASPTADPAGPTRAARDAALSMVGFAHVLRTANTVRFARAGTQITLNGIAQGYLTDRARAVLAAHGLPHALINLGEFRALGPHPDGGDWLLAIAHPEVPWRTLAHVKLPAGAALATSAGAGTAFDEKGRFNHLFDPRTGQSAHGWRSVTVQAPNATLADGLSTALAVAPIEATSRLLARYPESGALLLHESGELRRVGKRI